MTLLLLAENASQTAQFAQYVINGLTLGSLIALIALGYTMVYGIIGLINFAHGDLFMLGSFLALGIVQSLSLNAAGDHHLPLFVGLGICFIEVCLFCSVLNLSVDYVVYRPLRNAPKLAPLVSAIGVSFIFMNIGLLWGGPGDVNFPTLISNENVLSGDAIRITWKDLLVVGVTVPIMISLALFVKFTRLGKAMRAVEQNPAAARLMGINVNQVTSVTFLIGGALAGVGSVVYALFINTISFQMGFQNGLYAFTAAVLGGIGSIPGAVLGGLVIGLVRSLGSAYVGENWTGALVFGILIVILVFRPAGLLGRSAREKV